jgi:hypothetical protein
MKNKKQVNKEYTKIILLVKFVIVKVEIMEIITFPKSELE